MTVEGTPEKKPAHLRVENDSFFGHHARVVFVDADGDETDISSVVQSIDLSLKVGEVNTARLSCIKVEQDIHVDAKHVQAVIEDIASRLRAGVMRVAG